MTVLEPPFANLIDLIGNTPMVKVNRLDTGKCDLFLKLESQNPGGSIKDRIGLSMIEAAERDSKIAPGGTLIEATAGNTGLGLALVALQKGYKLVLVIPDKMSQEKIFHLRAMGAEIVMTRSDVEKGHPEYYQDLAATIQKQTPNSFFVNQFANPANSKAHETTTAPEIWEQMNHQVDAIVLGVGSGGTITGIGQYFQEVSPETEIILADPEGSVLAEAVKTGTPAEHAGKWMVEGIGEDFIPPILDLSFVKKAYTIPDKESFETVRALLKAEGILAGTSTGTLLAAALKYCAEQSEPKRVVTLVCDSGNKYLSKAYNDYWMIDQGFMDKELSGDLGDLISRRYEDRAVVSVKPDDTILAAFGKMKLYDVSQLPVLDKDGKLVGILDELDVLHNVTDNEENFAWPVTRAMTAKLKVIPLEAKKKDLLPIFEQGMVAIVADEDGFHGIVTRIDLLAHLRGKLRHS